MLLDTNILIDVLVGCREGETETVKAWLDTFPRLPIGDAVARETVQLRRAQPGDPQQPRLPCGAGGHRAPLPALSAGSASAPKRASRR
jgi:hypothetical protein